MAEAQSEAIDESVVAELLAVPQVPPGVCDAAVYEHGETVCVLAGPRMWMVEAWVRLVAKRAALPVDWHYAGGRADVLALVASDGERARVAAAVEALLPSLREAATRAQARGDAGAWELTVAGG